MKIIFLGTNGWYTTPTGNTPCILIDTKDHYIILDAGNGIYKLDKYITDYKPISMFISHFHLDHTSGLHTFFPKFEFPQGANIYVGSGRKKDFDTISNPPYTIGYKFKPSNIVRSKMDIKVHELKDGKNDIGITVDAIEQFHGYRDHGFRFEIEGKIISYTGDCGFSETAIKLAKNADVLICDCSNKKTENPDLWGHYDPTQAGTYAKDANVKLLILTHFVSNIYTKLEDRKWAEKEARKIFPNTIAAVDDKIIEL